MKEKLDISVGAETPDDKLQIIREVYGDHFE
jgi:hypothetical protein